MTNDETVAKWYTQTRKFPKLIGKMPDGTRIPGGPYTLTEFLTGLGVLVGGYYTMPLWGVFGLIGNLGALVTAVVCAVLAARHVPVTGRSPIMTVWGAGVVLGRPRSGSHRGRPITLRNPHRARSHLTTVVRTTPRVQVAASPAPQVAVQPAEPTAPVIPAPALTNVQRLLAAAAQRS